MARIAPVEIPGIDVDDLDQAQRVQLGVGGILAHRPDFAAALGPIRATRSTTAARCRVATGRADPSAHRLPQPVPQLHGHPLRRGRAGRRDPKRSSARSSARRKPTISATPDAPRCAAAPTCSPTNHLAIDDAVYDDLRRHFTEGELVEIGLNCTFDVGLGRLTATWDVTDDLPDAFRLSYSETATPWNDDTP